MMRLLCCVLLASSSVLAAETMRIAVQQDTAQAGIEGVGLMWGEDLDDATMTPLNSSTALITCAKGHVLLDGEVLALDAIRLRAGDEDAPISVNGVLVRGDVVVLPGANGVTIVNVLPLEAYLAGVLGSEMPTSFPLEALKAQAIAARTYALNKKLEQYGQPFHLGSGVISQVYKGLAVEDPRTHEAVEATRGLILTWQLQPIEAYFHASCGGHTESGLDALNRDLPYLKSVSCPCASLPTSAWSLTVSRTELNSLSGGKPSLQVQGRSPTGRVKRVQVGSHSVDAVTFRERLGYMKLKSLDFEVAKTNKEGWVLEGHGFGHGAGLCQWGAQVLAAKGWAFDKILEHYYPDTELQKLY
jgi:stage II sporulation protein D